MSNYKTGFSNPVLSQYVRAVMSGILSAEREPGNQVIKLIDVHGLLLVYVASVVLRHPCYTGHFDRRSLEERKILKSIRTTGTNIRLDQVPTCTYIFFPLCPHDITFTSSPLREQFITTARTHLHDNPQGTLTSQKGHGAKEQMTGLFVSLQYRDPFHQQKAR